MPKRTFAIRLRSNATASLPVLALAKRLGVSPMAVFGHWFQVLAWAAEYRPDGNLSDVQAEDIGRVAGWPGDPAEFGRGFVAECTDKFGTVTEWRWASRPLGRRAAGARRFNALWDARPRPYGDF